MTERADPVDQQQLLNLALEKLDKSNPAVSEYVVTRKAGFVVTSRQLQFDGKLFSTSLWPAPQKLIHML